MTAECAALPPGFLAAPVAHRGLHDRAAGRVENSRAAVRAAVAAGYGVEIDVQLSADGEAMVFHDRALDRLTGASGPVAAWQAAALGRIALTGGGETIPALAEILAIAAGAPLVIEIKDQGGTLIETGVGPLEARVASLLAAHAGPVAVMSFNPAAMAEMARLAPQIPRGLVACAADDYGPGVALARRAGLAGLAAFETVGAAFFSHDWRALPTPRTAALRAAGAGALCWTVRSAAEAAQAAPHADAITFEGFTPEIATGSG